MASFFLRFWPGANRLWHLGSLTGLLVACGFSLLLNLAIFAHFIWPERFTTATRTVVWFCVFASWWTLLRWPASAAASREAFPEADGSQVHLFQRAQTEYLRGNWFQAEKLIEQVLTQDPEHAPARLLCAGLYRRVQRTSDALAVLDRLTQSVEGREWLWEIDRERSILDRVIAAHDGHSSPTDSGLGHEAA